MPFLSAGDLPDPGIELTSPALAGVTREALTLSLSLSLSLSAAAAAAKSFQLCPTLCNSIDGSPPGSPVPGIFQERTLEWVAISFSNAEK